MGIPELTHSLTHSLTERKMVMGGGFGSKMVLSNNENKRPRQTPDMMYGAANGRTTGEAGFRRYAGGGPGASGRVKPNAGQSWLPMDDQWLWANRQIEKPCNLAAHLGRTVKAIWARLEHLESQNVSNRLKRQRSANGSSEAATVLDRAFGKS